LKKGSFISESGDNPLISMHESKKLRIVYITKNFPPLPRISGTQKYATYLCVELNKISDLTVIALDNLPMDQKGKQTEFKTIRAGQPFAVKAVLAAKKERPDVVVFGSGISSSFWLAPTLFFMRLALGSTPFVLHQLTEFNGKALPGLLQAGSQFVDKIVCANNSLYKYFSKPAGNKAVLLLPGLDLSQFPVRENKKGKKIRIGFFGHFHYVKGPDRLLRAFKQLQLPNAELVFSGIDYEDGAMLKQMQQQIKGMHGIAFLGTSENYLQLLQSCDFVVLPFRASGSVLGVSMAAIEAMAAGKPVIGSNVSVLNSIIEHKRNGLVVESDQQLADAIKLLSTDSKLRWRLSQGARKTAEEKFDIAGSSEKFLQICRQTIKK